MGGKLSAPKGVHPSGEKDKLLDQVTRNLVNQEDPYANVRHQGVILYSSYLTELFFRSKYDKTFIDYVLKVPNPEVDQKMIIVESIVYIDRISGCLPRPNKFEELEFYKYLKSLTPDSKKEGFDAIAENSKDMSQKNKDFLNKINRYPRAYAVVMGGSDSITDYGIGQKVIVQFPYDYDVYAGTMMLA